MESNSPQSPPARVEHGAPSCRDPWFAEAGSSRATEERHPLVKVLRAGAGRIPLVRATVRGLRKHLRFVSKRRFFIELRYGTLPALKPARAPLLVTIPISGLVAEARRFWFNNVPGTMSVDGHTITRRDIAVYGGPDPYLTHPVSQRLEWLSRIRQANLFEPHDSPQARQCEILCECQGDEMWTPFHQNFNFALGCDPDLAAPKCIFILPPYATGYCKYITYHFIQSPRCDQWSLVQKRRLARACQVDLAAHASAVDWPKYDVAFMMHCATNRKFPRPDIPVILYGHELLPDDAGFQWVIDWLRPDVLLVPNPTPWRENLRLPESTRIAFAPFAPSMFFTRPNLDPGGKNLDLMVVGVIAGPVYAPRAVLDEQIRLLAHRYRIEFSHHLGSSRFISDARTLQQGPDGPVRFLNQWSSYLGSAKYVIFGRLERGVYEQCVLGKYYETLGSGAVPIFPEVPYLKVLGILPFEHYIPLAEVEGNNERLAHLLDHYEDYRYIAGNAVAWCAANMDRMLFDDFETLIHDLTGRRFPKRLID